MKRYSIEHLGPDSRENPFGFRGRSEEGRLGAIAVRNGKVVALATRSPRIRHSMPGDFAARSNEVAPRTGGTVAELLANHVYDDCVIFEGRQVDCEFEAEACLRGMHRPGAGPTTSVGEHARG